jgi:hypothetical protein
MFERSPNQENNETSKEAVVESLRSNPEDKSLLNQYLDQREAQVRTSEDALVLNIEVAEIYRDSGLLESAKEAYEQAAEQAWQERSDILYEELMDEVDKIKL